MLSRRARQADKILRSMGSARNLTDDDDATVNRAIFGDLDGGESVARQTISREDLMQRLTKMIHVVRSGAKAAMGDRWNFREYLVSQFLVLVGSLGHYDYNFRESVRTLGLIAREIHKQGR